jgi:hypothetical protein
MPRHHNLIFPPSFEVSLIDYCIQPFIVKNFCLTASKEDKLRAGIGDCLFVVADLKVCHHIIRRFIMDYSQKVAIAVGMFLAIVMLCGGSGFLSYIYGYQVGHEISYDQGYNQGKDEGYQSGYKSGFEAGYKPTVEQETSSGYAIHNPTYQEMKTFLAQDTTDSKTYAEDQYVCVDFSAAVNNNAEKNGIRCAIVDIFHPEGYGHTIVAFETTDKGLIFIEPQFDREVQLIVGKSYSQINSFTPAPRDDTIERFVIVW